MDIEIVEVGPRDGLQNEKAVISVDEKVALVRACAEAGLKKIEVGSFVNEERVPQMAASGEVLRDIGPLEATGLVLIPNKRRLLAFLSAREEAAFQVPEIAIFVSATEGFSQANIGCSIDESFDRVAEIFAALPDDLTVRGYISCVTDCPYEGSVDPSAVGQVALMLKEAGCDTLALGDTVGKSVPKTLRAALEASFEHWEPKFVAAHLHDTAGMALANVDMALEAGVRCFDAAVGGLGGCPYAPGAPGNLSTEALVAHLSARGFETGVDTAKLNAAAKLARKIVGR
ncbi:MAG: hydroxymethylglutaryl-CoA lyase [Pseudomonadota bacterium]